MKDDISGLNTGQTRILMSSWSSISGLTGVARSHLEEHALRGQHASMVAELGLDVRSNRETKLSQSRKYPLRNNKETKLSQSYKYPLCGS